MKTSPKRYISGGRRYEDLRIFDEQGHLLGVLRVTSSAVTGDPYEDLRCCAGTHTACRPQEEHL